MHESVNYGIRVRSNVALPWADGQHARDAPVTELAVQMGGEPPAFARSHADCASPWSHGAPRVDGLGVHELRDTGALLLRYPDGVEFVLSRDGRSAWSRWPSALTAAYAVDYLIAPVLGLVLRLQGTLALHACAVRVGDRAVIVAGEAGRGKSTLSAALVARGHDLLADDVAAVRLLDDCLMVEPGVPIVRLWPDSVRAAVPTDAPFVPLPDPWDKERLLLQRALGRRAPLAAVYLLTAREAAPHAPYFAAMSPRSALIALAAESYAATLLDPRMREEQFRQLDALVKRVPVRLLTPHEDIGRLDALAQLVERDCAGMPEP